MRLNVPAYLERDIIKIIESQLDNIREYVKPLGIKEVGNWRDYLTKSALDRIQRDVPIAEGNFYDFGELLITQKLAHLLYEVYETETLVASGNYYYPNTGYMGWHTNSNAPCTRVYVVYADEDKKSFFRYVDTEGNVITDYDRKGLNIREFVVPENGKYWHCVGSGCNRYSFGFRIL